jgi:sporozoite microneme protein 2
MKLTALLLLGLALLATTTRAARLRAPFTAGELAQSALQMAQTQQMVEKAASTTRPTFKADVIYREGHVGNGDFPYEGIGFLGTGYDLVLGNPDGDDDSMVDPGFRTPILELVYDYKLGLGRDVRLLIPSGTYMMDEQACYKAEHASSIR